MYTICICMYCMHACMHACIYVHICVCMHACMCIYVHACMHVCMYIHAWSMHTYIQFLNVAAESLANLIT